MITIQRCDEQGDWIDEITRHSVYAAYRTARSKVLSTGKRYRLISSWSGTPIRELNPSDHLDCCPLDPATDLHRAYWAGHQSHYSRRDPHPQG